LANPAIAYEEAMLRRDVRTMARAVRQITGEPVTPASIRGLNEQLGIDAEEELVDSIARAAR
jgi:anti-sigma factor RsiW